MARRFLASLRSVIALGLLAAAIPANAYVADGTKWPGTTATPGTITLQFSLGSPGAALIDGSNNWDTVAQGVISTWNSNLGAVQFAGVSGSGAAKASPNPYNNVFFSPTIYGSAFGANVLAVTLSYTVGVTRVESDVLFNSAMTWDSYRGNVRFVGGNRVDDFRRVALHEFGHILGLNHPDQSGQSVAAVMNSTISNTDDLTADDVAGGQFVYGGGTPIAPSISSHPTNQVVTAGGNATFSVTAAGSPPFSYQWRKEGVPLIGSTNPSLTLTNVQAVNAGNYSVLVSNSVNSVSSNSASLTVNPIPVAPQITTQPVSQSATTGATVILTVAATGTPAPTYQWRKNNVPLSGETGTSLTLAGVTLSQAGTYTVLVSNSAATVTSNPAVLTVVVGPTSPTIQTQPQSRTVATGASVTFSVSASGSPAPTYQWRKDGVAIAGATSSSFSLPSVTLTDAGTYTVTVANSGGTLTSSGAGLTVLDPPYLSSQPSSQSVNAGSGFSFTVVASGSNPLTFQWRKNGSLIPGAATATLSFSLVQVADAGSYTATVTNSVGSVTSLPAILTVTPALFAPFIQTGPLSQSVSIGTTVTFSVVATGEPPPTFQWRKNGQTLAGMTSATLVLTNITPTHAGDYTVSVSNSSGTRTSAPATLTVNTPPEITLSPQNQSAVEGTSATFAVTAVGSGPLTYQWSKATVAIPNATLPSLTLSAITLANAGSYSVRVSNALGSVTSTAAILTVLPATAAPIITTQPSSKVAIAGTTASFTVVATGLPTPTYQWRNANVAIPGATSTTLTLPNVSIASAGTFNVVITNSIGTVTSDPATLTVITPPVITTQPASQSATAGTDVSFQVIAGGSAPLSYQWLRNGTILPGANSGTLTLPNAQIADSGSYSVTVTNAAGSVPSAVATLTVTPANTPPAISTQPASQAVIAGTTARFSVVATGLPAPTYQWFNNNVPIANATTSSLSVASVSLSSEGKFSVVITNPLGTVTSAAAVLTVLIPPRVQTQPVDQSIVVGETATFAVVATGTAPLVYAWKHNDTVIPGASSSTLTRASCQLTDAGTYSVTVTNGAGSETSAKAILVVSAAPLPPTIITQPAPQSVTAGASAAFRVVASGSAAVTYQWFRNDEIIPGATSPELRIEATRTTDAAAYSVVVRNSVGTATSAPAILAVTSDSRLINLSVRAEAGSGDRTLIVGFISQGTASKQLLIRGAGPALVPFGVAQALLDPKLEIYQSSGVPYGQNDDWPGTPTMIEAFNRLGAFAFAPGSKDAAILATVSPGSYSALLSGSAGTQGVSLVEVYDADGETSGSKLANLSVRNFAGAGDSALIVGFIIRGTTPQTLLIRGVGPTLSLFGVPDVLADPVLELYSGSTLIAQNGDWGGTPTLTTAFARVGAFSLPSTSKDAALLVTLQPGAYSARIAGENGTTGIALLEVYDVP